MELAEDSAEPTMTPKKRNVTHITTKKINIAMRQLRKTANKPTDLGKAKIPGPYLGLN